MVRLIRLCVVLQKEIQHWRSSTAESTRYLRTTITNIDTRNTKYQPTRTRRDPTSCSSVTSRRTTVDRQHTMVSRLANIPTAVNTAAHCGTTITPAVVINARRRNRLSLIDSVVSLHSVFYCTVIGGRVRLSNCIQYSVHFKLWICLRKLSCIMILFMSPTKFRNLTVFPCRQLGNHWQSVWCLREYRVSSIW